MLIFLFLNEKIVAVTHWNGLDEALPMSTKLLLLHGKTHLSCLEL